MKTLFTIAALLVVSMSFATERPLNNTNKILTEAAASPSFEMNMYKIKGTMVIRVLVAQKVANQLIISILDEKGNVLHKETTRNTGTSSLKLDIETLQAGTYSIEVANGIEKMVKTFKVTASEIIEPITLTINH